ncbi:MAG: ribonuclease HI family protein [Endomicrobia bacterium]|nr:ribonuclease HI family protein [Endomicrobiia bacterium]
MNFKLYFDGNKTPKGTTCSYVIISEDGQRIIDETIELSHNTTSNQAEYYGILKGIEKLRYYLVKNQIMVENVSVEIYGDSQLVIKQLEGQYECKDPQLRVLRSKVRDLLKNFKLHSFCWIPREENLAK